MTKYYDKEKELTNSINQAVFSFNFWLIGFVCFGTLSLMSIIYKPSLWVIPYILMACFCLWISPRVDNIIEVKK